jgi:Cd2+/Zn2+-exporting ATPase
VHPELIDEKELLHLAAHVERHSTHPIAAALRLAYPDEQDDCSVTDIRETAGHGVTATVNGKRVAVGNEKLMGLEGSASHPCELKGTVIHVSIDGVYAGHIVISDRVKADAAEAVAALHRAGVRRTVMLTGDEADIAAAVAAAVGVDTYHAGLLPADKVAHVEALLGDRSLSSSEDRSLSLSKGRSTGAGQPARHSRPDRESPAGAVAFVGDGINDAPVLARADLGIAMGALGSDAAIEAADVVLMDDKPSKVAEAVRIARRTLRIARENMLFAIGIKVLVLLLAAFGLATLWMAVFADVGVTVLAVLNAMRALKV